MQFSISTIQFLFISTYLSDIAFQADGEVHVHWKGASELVLASCRSYIDEDGNVAPMTEDKVCEKSNLLIF